MSWLPSWWVRCCRPGHRRVLTPDLSSRSRWNESPPPARLSSDTDTTCVCDRHRGSSNRSTPTSRPELASSSAADQRQGSTRREALVAVEFDQPAGSMEHGIWRAIAKPLNSASTSTWLDVAQPRSHFGTACTYGARRPGRSRLPRDGRLRALTRVVGACSSAPESWTGPEDPSLDMRCRPVELSGMWRLPTGSSTAGSPSAGLSAMTSACCGNSARSRTDPSYAATFPALTMPIAAKRFVGPSATGAPWLCRLMIERCLPQTVCLTNGQIPRRLRRWRPTCPSSCISRGILREAMRQPVAGGRGQDASTGGRPTSRWHRPEVPGHESAARRPLTRGWTGVRGGTPGGSGHRMARWPEFHHAASLAPLPGILPIGVIPRSRAVTWRLPRH